MKGNHSHHPKKVGHPGYHRELTAEGIDSGEDTTPFPSHIRASGIGPTLLGSRGKRDSQSYYSASVYCLWFLILLTTTINSHPGRVRTDVQGEETRKERMEEGKRAGARQKKRGDTKKINNYFAIACAQMKDVNVVDTSLLII